jgi:phage terminase small subunit
MPKTKNPITGKQSRFIEEYAIDCDATNAAIRAGYSKKTAYSIGHRLLGQPLIADRIAAARAKLAHKAEVSAERVIAEFCAIAFLNPAQFYDQRGNLLPIHEMPEVARRAITGIDVEEIWSGKGEERRQVGVLRKIRFAGKQQALDSLAKHLGLFTDEAPVSQTLIFNQLNQLIDDRDVIRIQEGMLSRLVGRQVTMDEAVAALRQMQPAVPGKPALRLVGPGGDDSQG